VQGRELVSPMKLDPNKEQPMRWEKCEVCGDVKDRLLVPKKGA